MAGDDVRMARNAQMMIHNCQWVVQGDAARMESARDLLSQCDRVAAETYAARTGLPIAQVEQMKASTTFLGASEAMQLGFADGLLDRDAEPAPQVTDDRRPANKAQLAAVLHRAGFPRAAADRIAAGGFSALPGAHRTLDLQAVAACFTDHVADVRAALQKGAR
jgi:hypothetical protein